MNRNSRLTGPRNCRKMDIIIMHDAMRILVLPNVQIVLISDGFTPLEAAVDVSSSQIRCIRSAFNCV